MVKAFRSLELSILLPQGVFFCVYFVAVVLNNLPVTSLIWPITMLLCCSLALLLSELWVSNKFGSVTGEAALRKIRMGRVMGITQILVVFIFATSGNLMFFAFNLSPGTVLTALALQALTLTLLASSLLRRILSAI